MKIKIEYINATEQELKELDQVDNSLLPSNIAITGTFKPGMVEITKGGKVSKSLGILHLVGDKVAGGITFSSISRTDGKVDAVTGTYVPVKGSVREFYHNNRVGKTRLEILTMVAAELTKHGLIIHDDPYKRVNSQTKSEFILNIQQIYFADEDEFTATQNF